MSQETLDTKGSTAHTPVGPVRDKDVSKETIRLNPNRNLGTHPSIQQEFGAAALVVGVVNRTHGIVDVRDTESEVPFVLKHLRNQDKNVDIPADRTVLIGRRRRTLRHPIKGVAETHYKLRYDSAYDTLRVRGVHPKIATYVTGHEVRQDDEGTNTVANFTTQLRGAVRTDDLYQTGDIEAPHGRYNGHPIIGRESYSMKDGVYGTTHSEQLHVDNEHPTVRGVVNQVIQEIREAVSETPSIGQRDILEYISSEVAEILKYDLEGTDAMSRPYYEKRGMIHLSEYIRAEKGVCRHQAVLVALIMEEAINAGLLRGSVGVRRNKIPELHSAHAWAEFRDEQKHVIVVDPTNDFVGTRDEAKTRNEEMWNYYVSDPEH